MQGYTAVPAADAFEAMANAKKMHPDLILLDVMIPPMDGLTFLMLLRDEGGAGIPVILITGLSDQQTMQRAQELGVKEYLVKSTFTAQELMDLIRKHLPPDAPPATTAASPSPANA